MSGVKDLIALLRRKAFVGKSIRRATAAERGDAEAFDRAADALITQVAEIERLRASLTAAEAEAEKLRSLVEELAPPEPYNQDEMGAASGAAACRPVADTDTLGVHPQDHEPDCPWVLARKELE